MMPPGLFSEAPPITGLVRPRLVHALQGSAGPARLGLVVAPSGSGKTTLLTHWATQGFESVAWHRTQPADAQPGRMLSRFAAAVAAAGSSECARSLPELEAMGQALTGPFCFVLDDFHLIANTCAQTELEQILTLSCPEVHLLIGSRRLPSLNLARSELPCPVTVD